MGVVIGNGINLGLRAEHADVLHEWDTRKPFRWLVNTTALSSSDRDAFDPYLLHASDTDYDAVELALTAHQRDRASDHRLRVYLCNGLLKAFASYQRVIDELLVAATSE